METWIGNTLFDQSLHVELYLYACCKSNYHTITTTTMTASTEEGKLKTVI
jgi:hypothetical protein